MVVLPDRQSRLYGISPAFPRNHYMKVSLVRLFVLIITQNKTLTFTDAFKISSPGEKMRHFYPMNPILFTPFSFLHLKAGLAWHYIYFDKTPYSRNWSWKPEKIKSSSGPGHPLRLGIGVG